MIVKMHDLGNTKFHAMVFPGADLAWLGFLVLGTCPSVSVGVPLRLPEIAATTKRPLLLPNVPHSRQTSPLTRQTSPVLAKRPMLSQNVPLFS